MIEPWTLSKLDSLRPAPLIVVRDLLRMLRPGAQAVHGWAVVARRRKGRGSRGGEPVSTLQTHHRGPNRIPRPHDQRDARRPGGAAPASGSGAARDGNIGVR